MDVKTPCLSAHRLVYRLLDGGDESEVLPLAVTALAGAFPEGTYNDPISWPLAGALTAHVRTDCPWAGWNENSASNAAELLKRASSYLDGCKADYSNAIVFLNEVLRIESATLGETHENYAVTLNNLAVRYKTMGRHVEAEPLFRQAIEIDETTIGREHPDYAIRLNNLASLLSDMGQHEDAEPLYRQAMKIDEATIGREHPEYATDLNNLAGLLKKMSRYEEAEPLYWQAIEIGEATIGREHPAYAGGLNNLAILLSDMGRYEEAEPLYRDSVTIFRAALGDAHPTTKQVAKNFLALLHDQNGDPAEIAAMEALAATE
jgi:tetratricopeptide (TPR) repeat protein